jgi:hypothetical protein
LEQARIEAQEVWDETFAKEMPDAYVRRQEERWRQDQITREQLEQVYANNTNYNIDEPSSSVAKRETAAKAKADAAAQETRERLEGEALAAYQEALGTEGIDGTIAEQALYDSYQEDGGPIDLRGAALGQQQLNQVEQFLVTLYEALDAPHQQYEKALRGELLDVPNKTANEIRFDNPADTGLSPLEPPYSQPNRALGGDPIALANQISSNADQVAESWSTFGTRLQENAQRSQIEAEISRDTQRLNGLREEQERLQRAQTAGGVRYTGIPLEDLPSRRAEVDDQIVRTEQNIARNQARIIELNNSNP